MTSSDSLRNWLRQEILQVLNRKSPQPPLLIWCDPQGIWKELLQAAAEDNSFELWAEDTHELILREKFYKTPRTSRVIWLPVSRDEITYFKVFELQAEAVKQLSLPEALSHYGIDIPSDYRVELEPILPAHAKEWLDYPKDAWKELTPGNAKSTLVDDEKILEFLATPGLSFDRLLTDNRFSIFARRIVEDFGLPEPKPDNAEAWRIQATASLLITDAVTRCPNYPPTERDRIIPEGQQREAALKLLDRWQNQINLIDYFEQLAPQADNQTTLQYWASHLDTIPIPLASQIAETTLFQKEIQHLSTIQTFEALVKTLKSRADDYQAHAEAFWGHRAKNKVCWSHLVKLAMNASLLYQHNQVEQQWKTPMDAVNWFTTQGWQVDRAGEALFQEDTELPNGLIRVRTLLRQAYLRHLDRINTTFSELLSNASLESLPLPFAGDAIAPTVNQASAKEPVAVLVFDACRYDIGCRLAEVLNQGEPTQRAEVTPAKAPIPSITALGMPFCLPGIPDKLQVEFPEKPGSYWRVTADGFPGDLSQAEQRRGWLKKNYKLKEKSILTVKDVLDSDTHDAINVKNLGKLIFVFGDELDDHDDTLEPFGLNPTIERYATLIRRLLSGGYNTILMVTDHGFFRWQPAEDENDPEKPEGDILWKSRRAIAGQNLQHSSAIKLRVTNGNLDCYVPRSINAFKTYGGLGFFHGGATLQELIIPVLTANWHKKAKKIEVVLKPITQITSLSQRIEVAPAAVNTDLFGNLDATLTTRQVQVNVVDLSTGKRLFKSKAIATIEPGGELQTIQLEKVEGAEARVGTELELRLIDADDEEILDRRRVVLKVDLDEWF